jgi:hypothetical protein
MVKKLPLAQCEMRTLPQVTRNQVMSLLAARRLSNYIHSLLNV